MSHLAYQVCGCDFFLSFLPFSRRTLDLVDCLKHFFQNNNLSYYSSEFFEFDQNYKFNFHLQACRSKIFLFIIDRFSLESELFLEIFLYAKTHSSTKHLPLLLPIVFDDDLDLSKVFKNNTTLRNDIKGKQKLLKSLLDDCLVSINISKIYTFENLLRLLEELMIDIIPIDKAKKNEVRHWDHLRPMSYEEEKFLYQMNTQIYDLIKNFEMTSLNLRTISPNLTHLEVSIPHKKLKSHITQMIFMDFHLICMDVCRIDDANYFNLVWRANRLDDDESKSHNAQPTKYLIMYDLNTAQIARFYKDLCNKKDNGGGDHWNIELVDFYVKNVRPIVSTYRCRAKSAAFDRSRSQANLSTTRSHDEILYICQFKLSQNPIDQHSLNKLKHSLIDKSYFNEFKESIKFTYQQNYMPIRVIPLSVNVNTVTNKHLYYTCLFKPVERELFQVEDSQITSENEHETTAPFYLFKKNLDDFQFLALFDHMIKLNYKLVDMKAYQDLNSMTKFSTIWARIDEFYEGTFRLFVGLKKKELVKISKEMADKSLFPRLITNYGYVDAYGQHVYAVFFCQV